MGRKTKPEKKKARTLGASVVSPFEDEIVSLAAQKDQNKAWFSGRLLLRGYIAFLADGQWASEEVKQEALDKELPPDRLAIVEAQLKVGRETIEEDTSMPLTTPLDELISADSIHDSHGPALYKAPTKKGGKQ